MSTSADIESLFSRCGDDAERFQKIRAESEWARARWPLLNTIELHADTQHQPWRAALSDDARRVACDGAGAVSTLPFAARPTRIPDVFDGDSVSPRPSAKDLFATDHPVDTRCADEADRSSGTLKKWFDQSTAPDSQESLVRLFERLRADTTEAGTPARFPLRPIRP
ncbi:BcsR/BcsP family cellulose biosynthesis protein [Burkholderia anthina]|uniref:BcsR/BcsP family cellulose biosynthesis protein n=1 Tax=Burkholderia anthina TaxID=179879 RepID=UPI001588F8D1